MLFIGLLCGLLATADSAQMRTVEVDAGHVVGTIRSLQGVNGGPQCIVPSLPEVGKQYRDLRIDLVRTHDFFGPVDIDAQWPNPDAISKSVGADGAKSLFPHWDADPEQESSYNWGPTDRVIRAIVNCGAGVFYRIGRSWGADPSPPADFDKYANLVKHVAMHYNDGWGHGFHYKIRYWEFWNEPDVQEGWGPKAQAFWSGTPEQFYELYEKVARTLKRYDPGLKVGAPAQAAGGFTGPYREGLIAYCAANQVPLDFYSWHRYSADPYDLVRIGKDVRRVLDAHGFRGAENIVGEWNANADPNSQGQQPQAAMQYAAFAAAAQVYLQDSPVDRSLFYRGDAGGVLGLFEINGNYRKKAYAFQTLGALLDTPERLAVSGADDLGFAVLAGRSADSKTVQVLISNYEIPEAYRNRPQTQAARGGLQPRSGIQYQNNRGYHLTVRRLPWGNGKFSVVRYRTTPTENWAETHGSGGGDTFEIGTPLPPPGTELIVIRKSEQRDGR
jgi:xylan 1,4-beta-xylosidase